MENDGKWKEKENIRATLQSGHPVKRSKGWTVWKFMRKNLSSGVTMKNVYGGHSRRGAIFEREFPWTGSLICLNFALNVTREAGEIRTAGYAADIRRG